MIEQKNKIINEEKKSKGSLCSVSGNNYEKKIHNIIKNCYINNKLFNIQKEKENTRLDAMCY